MCIYSSGQKYLPGKKFQAFLRMFVFGWKHRILIKRLLGQCLSYYGKIETNWYRIESKSVVAI